MHRKRNWQATALVCNNHIDHDTTGCAYWFGKIISVRRRKKRKCSRLERFFRRRQGIGGQGANDWTISNFGSVPNRLCLSQNTRQPARNWLHKGWSLLSYAFGLRWMPSTSLIYGGETIPRDVCIWKSILFQDTRVRSSSNPQRLWLAAAVNFFLRTEAVGRGTPGRLRHGFCAPLQISSQLSCWLAKCYIAAENILSCLRIACQLKIHEVICNVYVWQWCR